MGRPPSRVRLLVLMPDGTYYREWGEVGDGYVVGQQTRQLRFVSRHDTWPMARPVPYETLEDLLAAPVPAPPLNDGRRWILAVDNCPVPVQYDDTGVQSRITRQAQVANQTWRMERQQRASAANDRERVLAQAFFVLAMVVAALTAMFVLVGAMMFLL